MQSAGENCFTKDANSGSIPSSAFIIGRLSLWDSGASVWWGLPGPIAFPGKHFDAEHMAGKGGNKNHIKNSHNNCIPGATHLADVEGKGGTVKQLTFQSCWIKLWVNCAPAVQRESPTSTPGRKHRHWNTPMLGSGKTGLADGGQNSHSQHLCSQSLGDDFIFTAMLTAPSFGSPLRPDGGNVLTDRNMNQRAGVLSEWKASRSIYLLASLSKSKTAAVEIAPTLSIVKPEPSGERKYCLSESGKKTRHYRDTDRFPG